MSDMVNKKTWEEFRSNGLLWYINTILHVFGWAIVVDIDNDKIIDIYPARVKFRGFDLSSNDEGHFKISKYLSKNADVLHEECKE